MLETHLSKDPVGHQDPTQRAGNATQELRREAGLESLGARAPLGLLSVRRYR